MVKVPMVVSKDPDPELCVCACCSEPTSFQKEEVDSLPKRFHNSSRERKGPTPSKRKKSQIQSNSFEFPLYQSQLSSRLGSRTLSFFMGRFPYGWNKMGWIGVLGVSYTVWTLIHFWLQSLGWWQRKPEVFEGYL